MSAPTVVETVREEVKGMERESVAPRPDLPEWETPAFEEISVSAEVTAYFGVLDFDADHAD